MSILMPSSSLVVLVRCLLTFLVRCLLNPEVQFLGKNLLLSIYK